MTGDAERRKRRKAAEKAGIGVGDVVLSAGRLTRPSARCHRTLADECVARSTKGVVPLQRSQP